MGVYIIAEAGVNHNGDLNLAKDMVKEAKRAGCDCIKFQTYHTENLVTSDAPKAEYQVQNTGNGKSQYDMLKNLELTPENFYELSLICQKEEIDFMSTPFDLDSVDVLSHLLVKAYKVSSGDLTNKMLLEYIALKDRPIILSTGMATIEEIKEAVAWIENKGNKKISLLHCTSNYPAPFRDVNMKAMVTMAEQFPYPVGYSDHTKGIEISIMAVAMGAQIIEKHFTLSRELKGPDHKASLEPDEMKDLVNAIRNVEIAFGDGIKTLSDSEINTREVARKSLVTAGDFCQGYILKEGDLLVKRPGTGTAPKFLEDFIGKKLKSNLPKDYLITKDDIICTEK